MKYGSVCSGIEAATMAWHVMGWEPAFFSEIEAFPCSVLQHHYPQVPNLGDMTKYEEWPDHAIDLLVGGTPCQSFSVAGLRQGLADPRGNLMLTYLAIARRYQPRWLVWENVPGVLSSNGGRDFGTFIRGLEECGYHAAWRVLDAQFVRVDGFPYAVPQRRRRVFVVGYLGDWRRAAAVLLEREGMRGDSPPSRQTGQGLTRDVAQCLVSSGRGVERTGDTRGQDNVVAHALRGEGFDASEDGTGRGTPIIPIPFDTTQITSASNYSSPGLGDPCHPLAAAPHVPAIAFSACDFGGDAQVGFTPTLRVGAGSGKMGGGQQMAVAQGWAVRRLTPTECERLQGFPDNFTSVPHRGKPAADGPRYKALGNSMAVNCMRWLGRRIEAVDAYAAAESEAA